MEYLYVGGFMDRELLYGSSSLFSNKLLYKTGVMAMIATVLLAFIPTRFTIIQTSKNSHCTSTKCIYKKHTGRKHQRSNSHTNRIKSRNY